MTLHWSYYLWIRAFYTEFEAELHSVDHHGVLYASVVPTIDYDRSSDIGSFQQMTKRLKLSAQRFRYALFAFIHTQTYFEYYTLTLRLASLVKKAVIYAYWTKELFDICRKNVSYMATLPSVARHVIHADNLRPRH